MAMDTVVEVDDPSERLRHLFELHHTRLYRFALRLTRRDDEAMDLVQDAFVRAARDASRIPSSDDAAMSWLVRVVVNLARDRHRRAMVRELFGQLHRAEPHDPTPALDAAQTVRAALMSLSPRQRAVVALHHLDGESVDGIASMLGLARVTVRWHLAAARQCLAQLLRVKGAGDE